MKRANEEEEEQKISKGLYMVWNETGLPIQTRIIDPKYTYVEHPKPEMNACAGLFFEDQQNYLHSVPGGKELWQKPRSLFLESWSLGSTN